MSNPAAELETLKALCPEAELWEEGGQPLAFLPNLQIKSDGAPHQTDGLLWPGPRDGYETRLFLSRPFPAKGQNWNVFNIKGRAWHACSWNGVPASLPWLQILANHLSPLR